MYCFALFLILCFVLLGIDQVVIGGCRVSSGGGGGDIGGSGGSGGNDGTGGGCGCGGGLL